MIYKIKDEYLEVINYCNEYDEYIFKRFSQFEIVTNKEINNYLRFNETSVEININGDYKILKNRIVKTDIYPIINNVIAYIINDKSNMFVHSLVVSKGNNGILIIGEFGQGKSTFAKEFVNNGYEINSTDQTWIKNDNLIQGSIYNRIGENITFIDIKDSKEKVKIKKIIIIKGIVQNGDLNIIKLNNDNYYVKNIFKYANWHYDMPLLTEYTKLKDTGKKMIGFLKKNKIETYLVYGNADNIMEVIDD